MEKRGLILILALSLSIGVLSAKAQQNQKDNKEIAALIVKKRTYNKNNGTWL
ncbi:hypothetical protein PJW08_14445 [Tenacibaculum finnmarkense]|nr:hypothetical protein PJW08_14445 [Tenacibaculum finnmarkense]